MTNSWRCLKCGRILERYSSQIEDSFSALHFAGKPGKRGFVSPPDECKGSRMEPYEDTKGWEEIKPPAPRNRSR